MGSPPVAVSRYGARRLDRIRHRDADCDRVALQFAAVRFHSRLGLCHRRRGVWWCDAWADAAVASETANRLARMGQHHPALLRRPRILVITLRRLGDVLLTTPLIRSLR